MQDSIVPLMLEGPDCRIDAERVLTPALVIYPEWVDHNIASILKLLGSADRWRPHIKTAKLALTIRQLVEHGLNNLKCATTLELLTACQVGATDVLVAYPAVGSMAKRVLEIAEGFPEVRISALVENAAQVEAWRGGKVGLFLDLNPGMNRTGIELDRLEDILDVVRATGRTGLRFRGLHYYEGHLHDAALAERTAAAHRGYHRLMAIVYAIEDAGVDVEELITSGTPALPCALTYGAFRERRFVHRVSPGTVVYSDTTSLAQLPAEYGLRPAAVVVSTVVSHPAANLITCDAGHKAVSADAGIPNCSVLGHPHLRPLTPSEEHLPIEVPPDTPVPKIGERLYLVPRHVCPTINNFDHALIVRGGKIIAVEPVTARGREMPVLSAATATE